MYNDEWQCLLAQWLAMQVQDNAELQQRMKKGGG
jgi:hypothetical protein